MTTSSLTVLLIDDSAEAREVFCHYLRKNQHPVFQVLEADSGTKGWELFLAEHPDCVLLDYQLPDADGLEWMTKLIHEQRDRNIPVLLLTNHGNESIVRNALKSGAADYLVKKKTTADDLIRAVVLAVEKSVLIRQAEEQRLEIERSQKELAQFSHRASHDLQAPIRRIINYLEIMEKDLKGHIPEQVADYLSRSLKNAYHMRQLITNLLAYSLVGGGQQPLLPVNLSETVHEVLGELEDVVQEAQANITIALLPEILGNQGLLQQLFRNLISNAIRFRRAEPPQIDVAVDEQDGYWHLQVRDNGVGIPLKYLTTIFTVFERIDHTNIPKGTGIGLALCQKIVEFHGGKIWVNSVEGQGSTFSVTFPKIDSPQTDRPSAAVQITAV
ncbi:MAG: ATP-binding protein [Nitrospirales bacterium]|nr:response regulator [Nitrospira sp.]MDR4503079.1 ATP-binding protein [Nitrospirales bacterium]